ncbi:RNA-directed DNA polymerase reverse transcriptase, partial [Quillaja saponaria]
VFFTHYMWITFFYFLWMKNLNSSLYEPFLPKYEQALGQQMNINKSSFIVASNCSSHCRNLLHSWIGFLYKTLHFVYLGVPIFKGRVTQALFSYIEDRIRSRLQGWTGNLLSQVV